MQYRSKVELNAVVSISAPLHDMRKCCQKLPYCDSSYIRSGSWMVVLDAPCLFNFSVWPRLFCADLATSFIRPVTT